MENLIAFGPVPSRRLGMSLGINNIPPKICTYSCVYCQIGRTLKLSLERREFYPPEEIFRSVERRVREIRKRGGRIDYLSFVPDGEPTLDINIGREILLLKKLGVKIAVITNGSLLWMDEVRQDLLQADWVCVKVDGASEEVFRKIDRPYGKLQMGKILEGIAKFSKEFKGTLVSETMMVEGINDSPQEMEKIAEFLSGIKPSKSYLMVPTRPPAEPWVRPASEEILNMAYLLFKEYGLNPVLLTGAEKGEFGVTGKAEEDILSTASVHPLRKDAVEKILKKDGAGWEVVEKLIQRGLLKEIEYGGQSFFIKTLRRQI